MAVDLEAIARRGRCDVSSLKLALPLLEQGYEAPFLARYRRDELGGLDESTLWSLKTAVEAEMSLSDFRDKLQETWKATPLEDPAIGDAIRKSGSNRTLQRLGKRLRQETAAGVDTEANRLAVRILNPKKGDPSDAAALAESMESITDANAAVEGLAKAIPARLAGDPRVISAAVRWLSRNAKIHISDVHDPHIAAAEAAAEEAEKATAPQSSAPQSSAPESSEPGSAESSPADDSPEKAATDPTPVAENAEPQTSPEASADAPATDTPTEVTAPESQSSDANTVSADAETVDNPDVQGAGELTPAPTEDHPPTQPSPEATEVAAADPGAGNVEANDDAASGDQGGNADASSDSAAKPHSEELPGFKTEPNAAGEEKKKTKQAAPKKQKKISPRQRRRRWLVSVLKPLEGKRLPATKLSAFQIVMLGRALRSQVAVCSFEYDAAKLVGEIKRAVVGLNQGLESVLFDVVMQHEADIREAAEAAWWDELHERASSRLVTVVADHLRRHVNRGPLDAKVVMSIDAVGPKTAATSIVSADGRVLHGEDLPCQLSGSARSQTVAKMGELIHKFHVDLVVVSNGPARRACLIALGDLIGQSPENSIRWTVADRSGADSYSSSDVANSEMRSTPRRFRAAAWVAFSVLHPAQAYAKIDPLKLRLSSFQSELSDEALSVALSHIMASGASRGGVDANAAPLGWLRQLPGMSQEVAESLVARRETKLIESREDLLSLEGWKSAIETRQASPFLRVFQSSEVLDGTLIHPDDYALAKKLAGALEIELPPDCPPGYQAPTYETAPEDAEPKLVDATAPSAPAPVEDFDRAGEKAAEFKITDAGEGSEPSPSQSDETDSGGTNSGDTESGVPETGDTADAQPAEASASDVSAEGAASEQGDDGAASATTDEAASDVDAPAAEVASESGEDASPADGDNVQGEKSETGGDPAAETPTEAAGDSVPDPIRRPRPERAKVDKCIKEWQVGRHRVNQLVGWLCDPFGESATSDEPPAVLQTMPTLKTLQPGDEVIGVVVGVMSFGVFVELAPDCSGLIHVSRLSNGYVEDLNEAIQVGDVITAWVTGIDEKRRRVGLSALSPEQERKLEKERQDRDSKGGRGGYRRDAQGGRGRGRQGGKTGGQAGGGQGQHTGGKPQRAGSGSGDQGREGGGRAGAGGQARGGQGGRGGQGRGGQGRGGQGRGGQGRGGQGRGGQGRGGKGGRGRKPRQPESYRVESKPESKPISDAMQKGDEPLRSFGDLMQFYTKQEPETPTTPEPVQDKKEAGSVSPEGVDAGQPSQVESPPKPATGESGSTEAVPPSPMGEKAGPKDAETEKPTGAAE